MAIKAWQKQLFISDAAQAKRLYKGRRQGVSKERNTHPNLFEIAYRSRGL